jgi:aminopeptidase YwaD
MNRLDLVTGYVDTLVSVRPNRRTGSKGNREATRFFAETISRWGYEVDTSPFDVLDYEAGPASVTTGGGTVEIQTGPYSLSAHVSAPVTIAATVDELEAADCAGRILLLRGEICAEQLMPRNFTFYNPEHHRRIYRLLDEKMPAAVICATGRNPEVGGLYPFPVFFDGDFDIPNAYCTDTVGERLSRERSGAWDLRINGRRSPATACNVTARLFPGASAKVTVTAHIDAYEDSPGATDNAAGVAAALVIGELLADYDGPLGIEIVAMNGEDHYSAAGEMDYLARLGEEMPRIRLEVNIDGIAYVEGPTSWSTYGCAPEMERSIQTVMSGHAGIEPGDPWYSGDHIVFAQAGVPALAFTSGEINRLMQSVTHTARDTQDLVDPGRILQVSAAVAELVRNL